MNILNYVLKLIISEYEREIQVSYYANYSLELFHLEWCHINNAFQNVF